MVLSFYLLMQTQLHIQQTSCRSSRSCFVATRLEKVHMCIVDGCWPQNWLHSAWTKYFSNHTKQLAKASFHKAPQSWKFSLEEFDKGCSNGILAYDLTLKLVVVREVWNWISKDIWVQVDTILFVTRLTFGLWPHFKTDARSPKPNTFSES